MNWTYFPSGSHGIGLRIIIRISHKQVLRFCIDWCWRRFLKIVFTKAGTSSKQKYSTWIYNYFILLFHIKVNLWYFKWSKYILVLLDNYSALPFAQSGRILMWCIRFRFRISSFIYNVQGYNYVENVFFCHIIISSLPVVDKTSHESVSILFKVI